MPEHCENTIENITKYLYPMLNKKRNVILNDVNKRWMMFCDYICYSKFTL